MAELQIGMYVSYPIVTERVDIKFPRTFALGQIKQIDNIEGTVLLKRYDLLGSKQYYPDAYSTDKAMIHSVTHATSLEGFPIHTKDGKGIILQTAKKESGFFIYFVDTPGVGVKAYLESSVELDYTAFYIDPALSLYRYEFQNPMWFGARNVVSSTMHVLSNAVYGFKELTGCRVFLKPHQINTILRCLQNEEIRFMLADEVGMGKTIEACSIVKIQKARQHGYRVLYIVPRQLIKQWQFELRSKFNLYVSEYSHDWVKSNSDIIIAAEDIKSFSFQSSMVKKFDLVIVDETHKLLNKPEDYRIIQAISSITKNLLLLSATPISSRGEEYLRLLTLLNPKRYQGMTMDRFQSLVNQQTELSGSLFQLFGNIESYDEFYDSVIEDLKTISSGLNDSILDSMISVINIDKEDKGKEQVLRIIAYICEHYRLEKSVIRNRRNMPGIDTAKRKLEVFSYPLDGNEIDLYEDKTYSALLDWLDSLSGSNIDNFLDIAKELLSAYASSSFALKSAIARISSRGIQIPLELSEIVSAWNLNESAEIDDVDERMDNPDRISSRLLYVIDYIEQEVTSGEKVLIFTQYTETLKALESLLSKRFGKGEYAVFSREMSPEELENNANMFQGTPHCWILVCDSTGTEGRNFQMANRIIHVDTPWVVNDIEQRIGRLDRTGRDSSMDVLSVVFQSSDTIEEQLVSIWKNGIGLFENSISGLEIISGDIEKRIDEAIQTDIHYGLRDALPEIQQLTEDMRDGVMEEQFSDITPNLYSALMKTTDIVLDKYQGKENEIFAKSMTAWGSMAGFRPNVITDDNGFETFKYNAINFSPKASTNAFFVPPKYLPPLIGTFDRTYSIKREELSFYAPGDAVFDSIIRNALTSYRGRSAAFEMFTPSVDYRGLIFVWNVSPDMRYMYINKIDPILMARFRAFLPLEQIVTLIPESEEYANVTADEVMPLFADREAVKGAEHFGRRGVDGGENTPIGQFIAEYPKDYWQKWIIDSRRKAIEKAKEIVLASWDINTARDEARRLINSQNAAYRFYGKEYSESDDLSTKYESVVKALEHFRITLDAAIYVRLKK